MTAACTPGGIENMYTIHFDGACEHNPDNGKRNPGGIATYGWLIKKDNQRIAWGNGEACRGDGASNNVAEYVAFIEAIHAVIALNINDDLTILGDSQLIVNQINGNWNINKPHLRILCEQAQSLLDELPLQKTIQWIPREQNEEADTLSKSAYKKSLTTNKQPWTNRQRKLTHDQPHAPTGPTIP